MTTSPQVRQQLERLVVAGLHGKNVSEVAENLVMESLHTLLSDSLRRDRSLGARADVSRDAARRFIGGDANAFVQTRLFQAVVPSTVVPQPSTSTDTYRSAFISYGQPDRVFAVRIWRSLAERLVETFFFPKSASPGVRLHRAMSDAILEYDRVLLVCSEASLDRAGVQNEIEQILAREAREGGTELILPLLRDDFLFDRWNPKRADIARQLRDRVVIDFRRGAGGFETAFGRLLAALKLP